MTPENVRFHAAGHLAAAAYLVDCGMAESAQKVLSVVQTFVSHPLVSAPPQLIEKLDSNALSPNAEDIKLLEQWFCDPLNTIIEKSGGLQ